MSKPETSAAGVAAPVTPTDPVKTSALSAILGLVKPSETDVRPPAAPRPRSVSVVDDEEDDEKSVTPVPVGAPVAEVPATPAAPAEAAPAAAEVPVTPAEPKRVTVKKRVPIKTSTIVDEVKKSLAADAPVVQPVAPVLPVVPAAPVETEDLDPAERDEYDLVKYAESKDPARSGLSKKFLAFYADQKKFLEAAAAKASEEGDDSYDPTKDPAYKEWLKKHEPAFSRSDRKKFETDRIYERAKMDAAAEAEALLRPKLSEIERKTAELEHRPRIEARTTQFVNELVDGMPEDIVKVIRDNGGDIAKARELMPLEVDIVTSTANGARALAGEFLSVKNGLTPFNPFDPEKNPSGSRHHKFLFDFVRDQGAIFERDGGAARARDGKTFVSPAKWDPNLASKHWTFDNEDVLALLRAQAQREARDSIAREEARLKSLNFVRAKKPDAPVGAAAPAAAVVDTPSSPRTPAAALPGASSPAGAGTERSVLSSVLGLGRRT